MKPLEKQSLAALGLDPAWTAAFEAVRRPEWALGRARVAHKGGVEVVTADGVVLARASGKLRGAGARDPLALPVVGDWLAVRAAGGQALVELVLPRRTLLVRRAPGTEERAKQGVQALAANVDLAFVLRALPEAPNLGSLERYLAVAHQGGARAHVLLSKADLAPDARPSAHDLAHALGRTPVTVLSAITGDGVDQARNALAPGETCVLLGPSGAGKSTLLNAWMGSQVAETGTVRASDAKGRHTTSRRELFVLPGGGVVIDAPGLREVGLAGNEGVGESFPEIEALAVACRFRDCRHASEPACAVRAAVERGEVAAERLARWGMLR